jgi:hypothetical protein
MDRHGARGVYCPLRCCMQKSVRGATAIVLCGHVRQPLHTANHVNKITNLASGAGSTD